MCHNYVHFAVNKTNGPNAQEKSEKFKKGISHASKPNVRRVNKMYPVPKGVAPLIALYVGHLEHLTPTKKLYKYILSVIDGFPKYVWFYPVKTTNTK